ncbi:hypothetical protein [Xanthobacter sediminis]|uniref:hypothetical protein n=1 Tax=Xanthobacter sediminis TaxID=3119926 RepID=UPI00372753DC
MDQSEWTVSVPDIHSFRWVYDREQVVLMQVFPAESGWSFLLSTCDNPAFARGCVVETQVAAQGAAEEALDRRLGRLEVA